ALALGCGSEPRPLRQPTPPAHKLFIDVHDLGTVTAADVAQAHKKDLAIQAQYGITFKAYWVDEKTGKVYCLAEAAKAEDVRAVHAHAHGLIPQQIAEVTAATTEWTPTPGRPLFLDIHHLGKGA